MATSTHAATASAGKYLFLYLGEEQFGIEILRVHEISSTEFMQPVPGLPDSATGVLVTRGRQLPVLDLAPRLGVTRRGDHDQYVVVVEMEHRGERALAGLLSDRVNDVRRLDETQLTAPAADDDGLLAGWADGVALLDTDRLLEPDNLDTLLEAVAAVR